MFKVNNFTYFTPCYSVSVVNFEHVIDGWEQEYIYDPVKQV